MSLAIRYDLWFWVEELLKRGHSDHSPWPAPPSIFVAIGIDNFLTLPGTPPDMKWSTRRNNPRPSITCLKVLFAHGADHYVGHLGLSAWDFAIYQLLQDWIEIIKIFIGHGVSLADLVNKATKANNEDAQRALCGLIGVDWEILANQNGKAKESTKEDKR